MRRFYASTRACRRASRGQSCSHGDRYEVPAGNSKARPGKLGHVGRNMLHVEFSWFSQLEYLLQSLIFLFAAESPSLK